MTTIVREHQVTDKKGISVAKEIAEKTVWDTLAVENPTHAVISAPDEAAAKKKSDIQIAEIKKFVTTDSVLLDLGCGYGRVAQYLLPTQRLKRYVGVDSSYEMLQLFKQRYDTTVAEQSTPVTFLNADIHTLPLADASVDVVIVGAVFLHNHKSITERSMIEVKRVLKPGGTLLVYSSFPRTYTLMGVQGHLYQWLLNLVGRPYKNGPVRYFTKTEIKRLLDGFAEVELLPYQFALLPKSLIFLPRPLRSLYRTLIANPVNKILEHIFPKVLHRHFGTFFDVIAKR